MNREFGASAKTLCSIRTVCQTAGRHGFKLNICKVMLSGYIHVKYLTIGLQQHMVIVYIQENQNTANVEYEAKGN